MALYLVLHHQQDPNKTWSNAWKNGSDSIIEAITTTKRVADLCAQASDDSEMVFIHRCAYGDFPPMICCKAFVDKVSQIDHKSYLVTFKNQEMLALEPKGSPKMGDGCYQL
jgi:hypothetical protein